VALRTHDPARNPMTVSPTTAHVFALADEYITASPKLVFAANATGLPCPIDVTLLVNVWIPAPNMNGKLACDPEPTLMFRLHAPVADNALMVLFAMTQNVLPDGSALIDAVAGSPSDVLMVTTFGVS